MIELPRPPSIEGATGLVYRQRKDNWIAYWQCRTDIMKLGYRPTMMPLWRGLDPTVAEREYITQSCQLLSAEMFAFAADELKKPRAVLYTGTVSSLIMCFKNDEHSPYNTNLRYSTRLYYDSLCRRVMQDHGNKIVAELNGRAMLDWHKAWAASGKIAMAHSLMRMFRGLLSFGMTILDDKDCGHMCAVMSKQRFKMTPPREAILTADMAIAICAEAHRIGLHSIALAQAFQFEGMLRQKDVIGEWVPAKETGPAVLTHKGNKWGRGILWSEIDANLVLRHITSKKQKEVEIRLPAAPMVMEELKRFDPRPDFGPIVICETSGRPWTASEFRKTWREIATHCGVPKDVRNMDSRAGAITEATEAGAELEHIKHAATHSDIAMTQRYARSGANKAAKVLELRVEHRNKK